VAASEASEAAFVAASEVASASADPFVAYAAFVAFVDSWGS